jgi:hypothetical protein
VDVQHLLYELCTDLGLCLPPEAQRALVAQPPENVDAFTEAVLIAEGLDPVLFDKRLREDLRSRVSRAFAEHK